MPEHFNGIGTTYYGHRDPLPDGSYIATEWAIFFWVPVFPRGSYRLIQKDMKLHLLPPGLTTKYSAIPVPLNKRQVIKGYAMTAIIAAVIAMSFLFGR